MTTRRKVRSVRGAQAWAPPHCAPLLLVSKPNPLRWASVWTGREEGKVCLTFGSKSEFGKGCTAMLRKLNRFLNIVIGSFIGVFIGYGIYKFWHFKTYPNLYVMQSAPWYTELLLDGAMVVVVVVVCIILKLIIWKKLKP